MLFEKSVPKEAREAFRLDSTAGILFGVFTGLITPFLGFIARDRLNSSALLIGLISAAPFIGNMLSLFYANLMQGRRKMPYATWPVVAGRGLFLFTLFTFTPLSFAIVVAAAQLLTGVVAPAYAAVVKEIYPADRRGSIMAYVRVGTTFAMFIATLLAGMLLKHVSFRYIFPAGGLVGVASAFAFAGIRTQPVDPSEGNIQRQQPFHFLSDTFAIFRHNRQFMVYMIAIFIAGFGNLMLLPLYPIFQVDSLHITAAQLAILTGASTVAWMLSYPYWGRYLDINSPVLATIINMVISSLVPLIIFASGSVWMLLPAYVILGIVNGGTELAYFNSILHFAEDGMETRYQALHNFLLGIRGTVAPFCGAALVTLFGSIGLDVRYAFLVGALLFFVGILIQIIGLRLSGDKKAESM
ncbi:MAG: MFS transporter [Armatimonadota bacterium]